MSSGRIAGLDVLRGVAIGLVLLRHGFLPPDAEGVGGAAGAVGVAIFFALSGYLITGLLLSDIGRYGRVRYGRFYRNRVLRLYPALIAFVAGVVVVGLISDAARDRAILGQTIITALTYTTNLPITDTSSATTHLWTLATEEQFYLFWPVVLVLGIRIGRLRLAIVVVGLAMLLLLVVTLILTAPNAVRVYRFPTSWAVVMLLGAAARIERERLSVLLERVGRTRAAVVAAGLLLLLCLLPEDKGSWHTYLLVAPAVGVASIVLIFELQRWRELPSPAWWPLQALGRVSYGAYLWNYGIVVWLGGLGLSWGLGLLSILLTLLAATLSWFLIEKPAAGAKAMLDRRAAQADHRASIDARRPKIGRVFEE